jgi:hypothetical protein
MVSAQEWTQGLLVTVLIAGAAVYLLARVAGILTGKKAAGCGGSCHGCAQSNKRVTPEFVPADQLHFSGQQDRSSAG